MKTLEPVIAAGSPARTALPESIVEYIDEVMARPRADSYLIAVLQKVQRHYGYLPKDAMDAVSQLMQVPAARVSGVASFYHMFSFSPKGKHILSVCLGTACYVKGAGRLFERLKELLNVDENMVSEDKLFSLEPQRCVGACALAPVLMVDDKVYGNVQPDELVDILKTYGYAPTNSNEEHEGQA